MTIQTQLEKQGNWLFRYRGRLPLIFWAVGTLLYLRTEIYPETFFLEETPYEICYERMCLLICLFGLAIRVYTVGHTPANTSGRNEKRQVADSLNTTGMYSLVRHPLYFGNFFIWFGVVMMCGNLWFVTISLLFYWMYYERIMFAEEQFLCKKFGNIYKEWAARTPTFFPVLRPDKFVKPTYPFSLRKVLKKEKNGLVAIFIVFAFFNVLGEIAENKKEFDYGILALCLAAVVLYLVLKGLKKYTDLLNEPGR